MVEMNNIPMLVFIAELNELLNNENSRDKICLFLGAGVDISSGGILFSDLKKNVVAYKRNREIHELDSVELIDKEFDHIMESVSEENRCRIVKYVIETSDDWTASDGYKLLILLGKEKLISSVITTNFSNLLEKTQEYLRTDAFNIFSPATAIPANSLINSGHKKPIYLKMHGDMDGKLITHLTSTEIKNKKYPNNFVKLFEKLIYEKTIIFMGYSGWDNYIAKLFEKHLKKTVNIYWCNINEPDEEAPLIKVFKEKGIKINFLKCNFDECVQCVASNLFKNRVIFHTDSIFIWSLIKSKIENLQEEFIKEIKKDIKDIELISRTKSDTFNDFMIDNKNFCVLTGDSGVGKSVLMYQINSMYKDDSEICVIPLNSLSAHIGDLPNHIVKKLGYSTKNPYTVLYQFSKWAEDEGKKLLIIIDNLGNHEGTPEEISKLLNKLIELSYTLRNNNNIKFIITLRTDVWNDVYKLLDINCLNSVIWQDSNSGHAVQLEYFDDKETKKAYSNILKTINRKYLPDNIKELIKNPYIYGMIQKEKRASNNTKELNIYGLFEKMFLRGTQKTYLGKLAISLLSDYVELEKDFNISEKTYEYIHNKSNLKNLLDFEGDKITFKNDLVLECCLTSYFVEENYIQIFYQDTEYFEKNYLNSQLPLPLYYGTVRYMALNCESFEKTVKIMYELINNQPQASERVCKFVNDVLKYMAEYSSEKYISNIEFFDVARDEFKVLLPFIIHSIGFMNDKYAFKLLSVLRKINSGLYSLECNALINDRFSMGIRKCKNIPEYFNKYIDYVNIPEKPIYSFFLLIWIMGRVGADNTPADRYRTIGDLVKEKIKELKFDIEPEVIKNIFIKNAYFIFFNADSDIEEQYENFHNKDTLKLINKVKNKEKLSNNDFMFIRSMINNINAPVRFFIFNIMFVSMAAKDFDYALYNLDTLYKTYDNTTSAVELDFYSSVLFMSHYINAPCQRELYLECYKKMVDDFEIKMFECPSLERKTTCRKFNDMFEIEFEDGFNILTDYTYTAPMENYIKKGSQQSVDEYLHLIWELLDTLKTDGMYEKIIHVVKAINQMSVNWPEEALEALSKFLEFDQSYIRKSVIYTLKENYLRYPVNTSYFLYRNSEKFSDDELLQIYSGTESQIKNRTLEQLQWARIIYYIKEYIDRSIAEDLLKIFISSETLHDFIKQLIKILH